MERVILPGVNQYGAPALPLKYIAVNPQIVVIVRVTIYRLTTFLKVLMPILLVTSFRSMPSFSLWQDKF